MSDSQIRREDSWGQKSRLNGNHGYNQLFEMIEKKRECKRDSEEYKDLKTKD